MARTVTLALLLVLCFVAQTVELVAANKATRKLNGYSYGSGSSPVGGFGGGSPFSGGVPSSSSPVGGFPTFPTPSGGSPAITLPPVTTVPSGPSGGFGSYGSRSGRGTCGYWGKNTHRWPNILSILSVIGRIFGGRSSSVFGGKLTLLDALQNTNSDAFSELARQGTASLLNAYTVSGFVYSPEEVRNQFNEALATPEAASRQAVTFEEANLQV